MTEEKIENLENQENDDTMKEQTSETSAESKSSEDTLEDYKQLFEKQQKQINSQIKENQSLQRQINILMRNGASVTSGNDHTTTEPVEKTITFDELGKYIGRKDYDDFEKKG